MPPTFKKLQKSPYVIHEGEISRAKSILRNEISTGSIRFMKNRLSFINRHQFENVWEGANGLMEHVTDNFPMPQARNASTDGPNEVDSRLSFQSTDSASTSKDRGSDSIVKDTMSSKKTNVNISNGSEKTCEDSESDDNDCFILPQEKEVIEIDDDNSSGAESVGEDADDNVTTPGNHLSSSSLSNSEELLHWQQLNTLSTDTATALKKINVIRPLFKKHIQVACEDSSLLQEEIYGLVKRLTVAKNNIVEFGFDSKMKNSVLEKHFLKSGSVKSYKDVWSLVKSLCHRFAGLIKANHSILSDLGLLNVFSTKKLIKLMTKIK